MPETVKYLLDETRLPKDWYNIVADLPRLPEPVLHPGTLKPVGPQDLEPLFPMALIQQEVSRERTIEIPDPVREVYRQWRPSPLYRARRLERALDTPAKIYYKYEGVSPAGSHKPNTAVAQAFYNKEAGVKRLTTETGAGQWGSALAFAGALFGLEVRVYMVRVSFEQKPYRKALMEAWGAQCVASPSEETNAGRQILAEHPKSPGSLGIASDYPDIIVGCTGGGSNFAGIAFPFIGAGLRGGPRPRVIACEPAACPSLTRGKYAYDFGDTGHLTPLVKMHTLGSTFVPPGFHAGGLRYHGMSPLVSLLQELGLIESRALPQISCFEAGLQFARTEGVLPAPEANHAVRGVIEEALRCKKEGVSRTILFNLCGHGHFDMQAYIDYQAGKLGDQAYDEAELRVALAGLPKLAAE